MKSPLPRLMRLHALRSNLADVAMLHARQIDADLQEATLQLRKLQTVVHLENGLPSAAAKPDEHWSSYMACREVAVRLQATTSEQVSALQISRRNAMEVQQQAVMAREQMAKLAERCQQEENEQAGRREQLQLDEAHASLLFRRAMPTRF